MSNFTERLTELMDAEHKNRIGAYTELHKFLGNHAPAIHDLVVAAETHYKMRTAASGLMLGDALAKLEE